MEYEPGQSLIYFAFPFRILHRPNLKSIIYSSNLTMVVDLNNSALVLRAHYVLWVRRPFKTWYYIQICEHADNLQRKKGHIKIPSYSVTCYLKRLGVSDEKSVLVSLINNLWFTYTCMNSCLTAARKRLSGDQSASQIDISLLSVVN